MCTALLLLGEPLIGIVSVTHWRFCCWCASLQALTDFTSGPPPKRPERNDVIVSPVATDAASAASSTKSPAASELISHRSGVNEAGDAKRLTAGEQMKADAEFAQRLLKYEVDLAAWRHKNGLYEAVKHDLEHDFGPNAFAKLMATFVQPGSDPICAQYGARGLCRAVGTAATKK